MGITVEPLLPAHERALRELLLKDPPHNLYLLGLLEEFGVQGSRHAFHGRFADGALTAAVFVGGDGGLVVPSSGDAQDFTAMGEALMQKVKLRAALGDQACVDALARYLCPGRPKRSRAQRLYKVSADDLGPFTNPTLRLATEADLDPVVELSAAWCREVHEQEPLVQDRDGFVARVRQRIRGKRTYVLESGGRLVFKIDVGSRSQYGAELEGLYTLPEERLKGHATLSLGQISRHLLSSLPRLALRIDDKDPALPVIARKVGYNGGRAQRLVLAE